MRKKHYFGTDGIRGRVGLSPISPDFILKLGWACGRVLAKEGPGKVLIGKDTRISGYMFEAALEAGLSAAGIDIELLGPMPTPAIAYLTRTMQARAGIVISASHNSYRDNGIKFFNHEGLKLADEVELEIEGYLGEPLQTVDPSKLGKARRLVDAQGRYIEFCKSNFPRGQNLQGLKVVLDCAHGATYQVAPNVFKELGADVVVLNAQPDGLNINLACGSTNLAAIKEAVKTHHAHVGIALDGDGDRVLLIDETGEPLCGDEILWLITKWYQDMERFQGGVVGTVMSNLGLEKALGEANIPFIRTPVGDRHVIAKLKEHGWLLGGEASGHIVCFDANSTGDGIVSALQVLASMMLANKPLSVLRQSMQKYPQVMHNVAVQNSPAKILSHDKVKQVVLAVEKALSNHGRLVLRASGTEPVIRVMLEGNDPILLEENARVLVDVIQEMAEG